MPVNFGVYHQTFDVPMRFHIAGVGRLGDCVKRSFKNGRKQSLLWILVVVADFQVIPLITNVGKGSM